MLEARIAYTAPLSEGPHVEISARLPVWRTLRHFLYGLTVARAAGVNPEALQAELDTLQAFRDDLAELLEWAGDGTADREAGWHPPTGRVRNCPRCHVVNYAFRRRCFHCREPLPAGPTERGQELSR